MICCADGFFGGGRYKAIQKIGFMNIGYAVLIGFFGGGGLNLNKKSALERYDMIKYKILHL